MKFLLDGLVDALGLLASGDPDTWQAVWLSLWTSLVAVGIGATLGATIGTYVGLVRPRGGGLLVGIFRAGMSLPTVFIGLVLYGFLCSRGPLGELGLLYTPTAIVIGQTILATPILASHAHAAAAGLDARLVETLRTHGGGTGLVIRVGMSETRPALAAAVLSAFGRCITELGIALAVGGGIRHYTRTLPALVSLDTSMGEFDRGLAAAFILVLIACGAALLAPFVSRERRR